MNSRKIVVSKRRDLHMYAELAHAGSVLLKIANKKKDGYVYPCMASLLLSAFAAEAYLNHLGTRLFKTKWSQHKWLGPIDKLKLVSDSIGIQVRLGHKPFSTFNTLVKFRNYLAHGHSRVVKATFVTTTTNERALRSPPQTKWDRFCTLKNAETAKHEMRKLASLLSKQAGFGDDPFADFGGWFITSTLVEGRTQP